VVAGLHEAISPIDKIIKAARALPPIAGYRLGLPTRTINFRHPDCVVAADRSLATTIL
jgi:hypothetical protein